MHSQLILIAAACTDQISSVLEPAADEALAFDADLCGEWISAKLEKSGKEVELLSELEWFRQGHQPEASQPLPVVWAD